MVAHADRISIGKAQAQLSSHFAMVFDHDIALATDVLSRRANLGKDSADQLFFELGINHSLFFYESQISAQDLAIK